MQWNNLNNVQQLQELLQVSEESPVLIFKHSTRCSISRTALDRLERNWNENEVGHIKPYFLDLISFRDVSNAIQDLLSVEHESPQLIVVQKGKATYHRSHFDIDYKHLQSSFKN
ncbi:bacillithiol system redox-active protein YtxJ [Pseudochryseolinea flava]|uniref:Bacillithiol system redox-active protein YtxJ n=1 Tax=Pseudochryseolinea flava TaxID=2059302 RepID=A0A364Y9A2_9BACT|nr:bacillithiol system redox-active protein YtxJ [Pseudochryseolinea flava]RAW03045.1 bacillithiol system redox-active protein YtxJ [Pseudochryseolinea flava]